MLHNPDSIDSLTDTTAQHVVLLLGATGRLGTMIRSSAPPPPNIMALFQTRHKDIPVDGNWVFWDPKAGDLLCPDQGQSPVRIDTIINFIGATPTAGHHSAQEMQIANCMVAQQVEYEARRLGVRNLIQISSASVYGRPFSASGRVHESDRCVPLTAYGETKLKMENDALERSDFGLNTVVLRLGNVIGADALVQNAMRTTPERPLKLSCFADGSPVRSYISPQEMTEALWSLVRALADQKNVPHVMNLSRPEPVRLSDLLEALSKQFDAPIHWVYVDAPQSDIHSLILDTSLLERIHGFERVDDVPNHLISQYDRFLRQAEQTL